MAENSTQAQQEIIAGLTATPAHISPKYFYDTPGSTLFEEITRLPEYYPTRSERQIMARHGEAMAQHLGSGRTVIEFGAGSCEKARALCHLIDPARFIAVDISADFLHQAAESLRQTFPTLDVRPLVADLTGSLRLPDDLPRANRLLFYPGSSIGNFDPPQALDMLNRFRQLLDNDGALLIGIDLAKTQAILEAAYDDAKGITAAFNRNVLSHVNRLIGSNFDPPDWRHVAFFNGRQSRIEMHLEASADSEIRWPGGHRRFATGERIHTENSYKYRLRQFSDLLARAGFSRTQTWTDKQAWFAVVLARP